MSFLPAWSIEPSSSLSILRRSAVFGAFVDMKGVEKPAGPVPSSTFAPGLSPDGKQVAFDAYDDRTMSYAIYVYDLATRRSRKLGGAESSLYWPPADGTGTPQGLLETARAPEFLSAANRFLSFITLKTDCNTADHDIWSYSFETKTASPTIVIPKSGRHSSRFSPDGHWIACISDETGRHEVFVQPFPVTGAKYQITENGGGHPMWSPDGKQVFYDNNQRRFSVQIQTQPTFAASEPNPLLKIIAVNMTSQTDNNSSCYSRFRTRFTSSAIGSCVSAFATISHPTSRENLKKGIE